MFNTFSKNLIFLWIVLILCITNPDSISATTIVVDEKGGHGDKVRDVEVPYKRIEVTPTPKKVTVSYKPTPVNKTQDKQLHPTNSSLYVTNPQVHIQHDTEYIGGVVDVAYGLPDETKKPVVVVPKTPAPRSTPKTVVPKPPTYVKNNNLEELQHEGGWGGTYVHNDSVIDQPGWPIPNANGSYNSSYTAPIPPVQTIEGTKNPPSNELKQQDSKHIATVGTNEGVSILSPPHVRPTYNHLEHTSVTFGSAIVQSSTSATNSSLINSTTNANSTSEAENITSSLNTEYNNVEYGGVIHTPRVDIPGRCSIYGQPSFIRSFDGKTIMSGGLGEFVLYSNDLATEQVNIIQRRSSVASWVDSFAFRTEDQVLSVSLERRDDTGQTVVAVRLNGRPIALSSKPKDIAGYHILQEGKLDGAPRLSISTINANGTKVAATFYRRAHYFHMNVFVQVNGSHFAGTKGLCGRYNFLDNDDMMTPDNQIATLDEQFVASWGVQHQLSPYNHFLPHMDTFVVDNNSTTYQLERDAYAYQKASILCNTITVSEPNMKSACRLNTIMGHHSALEEIHDIIHIMSEGSIQLDSEGKKCIGREFSLSPWSSTSNCSSTCGKGFKTRKRQMIVQNNVCGHLTQKLHCQNHCSRPDLWTKCAIWGGGHVATFDQVEYDFHATGEYIAYYHAASREEISILKYRPSNTSSIAFVNGVSFRLGADLFTVQQVIKSNKPPVTHFTFNRMAVDLGTVGSTFGFFHIKLSSRTAKQRVLEVKVLENTVLTVIFGVVNTVPYMNAFLEIHGPKLGKTRGLCGAWTLNPMDDLLSANGNIEQSGTSMAMSYKRDREQSSFFYPTPVAELPPPVNPTAADLHPSYLLRKTAKRACNSTHRRFKQQCLLDVTFLEDKEGAQSTLDVQSILADHRITADGATALCLQQPGSKLGNMTAWSTKCTRKCGGGKFIRTQPVYNAMNRKCGVITITKPCNLKPCPEDCQVSAWSAWTSCSTSCGNGTRYRVREVLHPTKNAGKKCPPLKETVKCKNMTGCCKLGSWGKWGICKNGIQTQYRKVNFDYCGWSNRTRPCCEISHWSSWTPCVNGTSHRQRLTRGDNNLCSKVNTNQTKPCCNIGDYGDWSKCYNGIQYRQRYLEGNPIICNHFAKYDNRTCCERGPWSEYSICNNGTRHRIRTLTGDCKHDRSIESKSCCSVGDWQPHTRCKDGFQTKRRTVTGDRKACKHIKRKKIQKCCIVHNWGRWSQCKNGIRTRTRKAVGHPDVCNAHPKVENKRCCRVDDWSAWSTCKPGNNMTAPAYQSRSRTMFGDPAVCGVQETHQNRTCCAVLSEFSQSEWTQCKDGYKQRQRFVAGTPEDCALVPSIENRTCCDIGLWSKWTPCHNGVVTRQRILKGEQCHMFNSSETKPCCHVHDWSDWSGCVNGYITRTRQLEGDPAFCRKWKSMDSKPCCEVGAWSDFSECENGRQSRSRNVTQNPTFCGGIKKHQVRACCKVSVWSGWTQCKNGVQQRTRTTVGDAQACLNIAPIERQKCCHTGKWSKWSKCTNYTQHRERKVTGHEDCDQDISTLQTRTCGILACKPGNWSTWSTCQNGTQHRHRAVWGADSCTEKYPANQTRNCTVKNPCVVGEWSAWTKCKDGQVRRFRTLSGDCHIDQSKIEEKPCRCNPGPWSKWSPCENNQKHRHRKNHGTCASSLPNNETISCQECTVSAWGLWGQCIDGHRNRTRTVVGECLLPHSTVQVQECTPEPAKSCHISKWSDWTDCDPETHQKHRVRTVGGKCNYNWPTIQYKKCHCFATHWGPWSQCQPDGKEHRFRNLTLRSHGCSANEVKLEDTRNCCEAMKWSNWTNCSEHGLQTRTRTVNGGQHCNIRYPTIGHRQCCNIGAWSGPFQENGYKVWKRDVTKSAYCQKRYKSERKKEHCLVGAWNETWSACNANGTQIKTRYVDAVPHCLEKHEHLKQRFCCEKSKWSDWSTCVQDGSQYGHTTRQRTVQGNAYCREHFPEKENKSCADCELGVWSHWSSCQPEGWIYRNRTVGGGPWCVKHRNATQYKPCCHVGEWQYMNGIDKCDKSGYYRHTRNVTNTPYCLKLFPNYKLEPCCFTQPWTPWTQCNVTSGRQTRTRQVGPNIHCIEKFAIKQNRTCCVVGDWSAWNENCINGKTTRNRTIQGHESCQIKYKSVQTQRCCKVGPWSRWSRCRKGFKHRTRSVPSDSFCQNKYKSVQKRSCCSAGNWTQWSDCLNGHSYRTRKVHGGKKCLHKFSNKQSRQCNMPCQPSEWSEWSTCSDGIKRRTRTIKGGKAKCSQVVTVESSKCCECSLESQTNNNNDCPCAATSSVQNSHSNSMIVAPAQHLTNKQQPSHLAATPTHHTQSSPSPSSSNENQQSTSPKVTNTNNNNINHKQQHSTTAKSSNVNKHTQQLSSSSSNNLSNNNNNIQETKNTLIQPQQSEQSQEKPPVVRFAERLRKPRFGEKIQMDQIMIPKDLASDLKDTNMDEEADNLHLESMPEEVEEDDDAFLQSSFNVQL